jgi:PAS domain S-box
MDKQVQDQLIRNLMFELDEYAIIMIDKEGYILSWNKAAERIKGYTEEEIIGKSFRIFYSKEDRDKGKPDSLLRTAATQGRAKDKGWRIRKDGNKFWGSIVITSIHDPNGEIIGYSKITQDLTNQRKLETKFKNILENAPDSILVVDKEGSIKVVNERAEQTFGYKKEELLNKKVEILLPSRYLQNHPRLRQNYIESPYQRAMGNNLNLFGITKDGVEFPVDVSISPLIDHGQDMQIIVTIRDITEKKILIDEIIVAKEKAEESNRLKSAFLATMSHELRTPLNHIVGFSNIISNLSNDHEISEYATIIESSGNSLLGMIEDVISLANMTNHSIKLRPEKVKLSDFFYEIKVLFRGILNETDKKESIDLIFVCDNPELLEKTVITDKYKSFQAIVNLFNNAIKYTNKGTITIKLSQPDEKTISISISDTGIGIPPEKQKEIFEFFRQGDDSSTRLYGGIGVGLTIADKIATNMGGKISLTSEVGKGSDFTLILPIEMNRGTHV